MMHIHKMCVYVYIHATCVFTYMYVYIFLIYVDVASVHIYALTKGLWGLICAVYIGSLVFLRCRMEGSKSRGRYYDVQWCWDASLSPTQGISV